MVYWHSNSITENAMSIYLGAFRNLRTNMFTAERGDRPDKVNIAILATDGRSEDRYATWEEARALRKTGAHVILIGLGPSVSQEGLANMASYPVASNIFMVQSFSQLNAIRPALVDAICNSEFLACY